MNEHAYAHTNVCARMDTHTRNTIKDSRKINITYGLCVLFVLLYNHSNINISLTTNTFYKEYNVMSCTE